MYEIDLKIGGMMCGMCESHINDAVRKALPVKKVTSSHSKGQTVILSEEDEKLYKRLGIHVSCEPKYEVKKLYHK